MSVDGTIHFPLVAKRMGGEVEFDTGLLTSFAGKEFRNQNRADSRRRFNAAMGIQKNVDVRTLVAFFSAMGGRAVGFLLKDWLDFTATQTATTLSTGITTQGRSTADPGSTTVFQLEKWYAAGAQTHKRKIKRPKQGTLLVYVNGLLQTETTNYTVNYSTGKVTFTAAPAAAPTWAGEFDCQVRFEQDRLPADLIFYRSTGSGGFSDLPDVPLVEIL